MTTQPNDYFYLKYKNRLRGLILDQNIIKIGTFNPRPCSYKILVWWWFRQMTTQPTPYPCWRFTPLVSKFWALCSKKLAFWRMKNEKISKKKISKFLFSKKFFVAARHVKSIVHVTINTSYWHCNIKKLQYRLFEWGYVREKIFWQTPP